MSRTQGRNLTQRHEAVKSRGMNKITHENYAEDQDKILESIHEKEDKPVSVKGWKSEKHRQATRLGKEKLSKRMECFLVSSSWKG